MKTILFNPFEDRWICLFYKEDLKKREHLFIVLESRGFTIFHSSRSHIRINLYPHIYHEKRKYNIGHQITGYVKEYLTCSKEMIIVSYEFLIYYFSPKYLF